MNDPPLDVFARKLSLMDTAVCHFLISLALSQISQLIQKSAALWVSSMICGHICRYPMKKLLDSAPSLSSCYGHSCLQLQRQTRPGQGSILIKVHFGCLTAQCSSCSAPVSASSIFMTELVCVVVEISLDDPRPRNGEGDLSSKRLMQPNL